MASVVNVVEVPATKSNEYLMVRIAGTETAEQLGVPVGTPIEGRHVVTPLDGHKLVTYDDGRVETAPLDPIARVVTPEEAAEIQARIDLECGPVIPEED